MKISKFYHLKIIYLIFFIILCSILFYIVWNTYSNYQKSITLSNEINTYLENVSLEQVEVEDAEKIIEFISPDKESVMPVNLVDPFEVVKEEKE